MKFSDPLDQASHLEQVHNEAAIEEHRRKLKPEQVKQLMVVDGEEVMDWPHKFCINEDCGEPIEPKRLEAGRVRCFSCQSLKEERDAKFYSR